MTARHGFTRYEVQELYHWLLWRSAAQALRQPCLFGRTWASAI